ncbi:MAG: 3-methylornithine--L-lysine ligase PylC [Desulfobacula sp.]|uniref:3-methylornithine--L-lysine ligase PylC n=1 Tax=Desulfobacula sp. TaxID=2593537 RepID=UPI0025B8D13F|nr:3-methylornithine--L-lysine ligase PylC [Desulfobacula sp.]MCD4720594.1 3-methylornithine--L-lysine ligase PylC [Desulfobacula sp.]
MDRKQTERIDQILKQVLCREKEKNMMIAVIGGKLQGVEAVYLAQKAGWKTLVIDKNPDAPAIGLCDWFLAFEFSLEHPVPADCPKVDIILPAIEDIEVLTAVKTWATMKNIPLAFDLDAYGISSSKLKSNALFRRMNLSAPKSWPGCSFPVVVKPDRASGSQGVEVFKDAKALFSRFSNQFSNWQKLDDMVIQQYLEGPSFSIEVVGSPGKYQALQVTDLSMDKAYDCKRVTAPTQLPPHQTGRFKETALAIAEKIHLTGIMDVEVVLNNNELKLLEIDARLPSQTPMAVYWSTRINMVEMVGNLFLNKNSAGFEQKCERFIIVEHLHVCGADLEVCGEHIMIQDGPLTLQPDFFGANEAITSYAPGKKQWVATLIFFGNTYEDVTARRQNCYEQIKEQIH